MNVIATSMKTLAVETLSQVGDALNTNTYVVIPVPYIYIHIIFILLLLRPTGMHWLKGIVIETAILIALYRVVFFMMVKLSENLLLSSMFLLLNSDKSINAFEFCAHCAAAQASFREILQEKPQNVGIHVDLQGSFPYVCNTFAALYKE